MNKHTIGHAILDKGAAISRETRFNFKKEKTQSQVLVLVYLISLAQANT